MTELFQLEFARDLPAFAAALIYFLFWGSVIVFVCLLGFAIYDKYWGPLNIKGDLLQDIDRWVKSKVQQPIPSSYRSIEDQHRVEVYHQAVQRKTFTVWGIRVPHFDFPTFRIRNRPFDHEWD